MYQWGKSSLQKHLDFIICDLVSLQIAYLVAYVIRHGWSLAYADDRYKNMGILLALLELCVCFFMENYKGILVRGYFQELKKVFIVITLVIMGSFTYFFITKTSWVFSRAVFLQMWVLGICLTLGVRIWRKKVVRRQMSKIENLRSIILVSDLRSVVQIIKRIKEQTYKDFYVCGLVIIGENNNEKVIEGIPIVADESTTLDYLKEHAVDEVFVNLYREDKFTETILDSCEEMGITVHYNLGYLENRETNAVIENFAGFTVLTNSIKIAEARQLLIKRVMDIVGGVVGCMFTGLIFLIFGPIIYIQSPGPVFFSQIRVGKNGRKFKIYKFRSMYIDAEERKKELMLSNKMNGLMFKMDDDPRVTKIGRFLRKSSLDEFPQFWNILKGEMSLVGTRPPTVDEYEQYKSHHKVRLAVKPGLTGLWQVSGRSDIVDFEEVVSLDKKYIMEWDIGLDIKILWKTVWTVVRGKGSV